MFLKCLKIKAVIAQNAKISALSPEASAEVIAHTNECTDCSREYAKTQRMREAFANAVPYKAPADFTSNVMNRIESAELLLDKRTKANARPTRSFIRQAVAAAIILAIGLSIVGGYYATTKTDPIDNAILSAFNATPMDIIDNI